MYLTLLSRLKRMSLTMHRRSWISTTTAMSHRNFAKGVVLLVCHSQKQHASEWQKLMQEHEGDVKSRTMAGSRSKAVKTPQLPMP
jgi:hypothetical protein